MKELFCSSASRPPRVIVARIPLVFNGRVLREAYTTNAKIVTTTIDTMTVGQNASTDIGGFTKRAVYELSIVSTWLFSAYASESKKSHRYIPSTKVEIHASPEIPLRPA